MSPLPNHSLCRYELFTCSWLWQDAGSPRTALSFCHSHEGSTTNRFMKGRKHVWDILLQCVSNMMLTQDTNIKCLWLLDGCWWNELQMFRMTCDTFGHPLTPPPVPWGQLPPPPTPQKKVHSAFRPHSSFSHTFSSLYGPHMMSSGPWLATPLTCLPVIECDWPEVTWPHLLYF